MRLGCHIRRRNANFYINATDGGSRRDYPVTIESHTTLHTSTNFYSSHLAATVVTHAIALNEVIVTTVAIETTDETDTVIANDDALAHQVIVAAVAMIETMMHTLRAEATGIENVRTATDESVAESETGIETEARAVTDVTTTIEAVAETETNLMIAAAATAARMRSLDRSAAVRRLPSHANQHPI